MKVIIKSSTNPKKKHMAIFYEKGKDGKMKKKKTTHFGSAGMSDYTINKDKERRKRYLDRHRKRENWNNPMSAGSLAKNILWGDSTSKTANIRAFKKKFNLS
tara:strand:+ start:2842 stop:3147 length:306 start_codon:yes stop_codon:yes gene_type:complete